MKGDASSFQFCFNGLKLMEPQSPSLLQKLYGTEDLLTAKVRRQTFLVKFTIYTEIRMEAMEYRGC